MTQRLPLHVIKKMQENKLRVSKARQLRNRGSTNDPFSLRMVSGVYCIHMVDTLLCVLCKPPEQVDPIPF